MKIFVISFNLPYINVLTHRIFIGTDTHMKEKQRKRNASAGNQVGRRRWRSRRIMSWISIRVEIGNSL